MRKVAQGIPLALALVCFATAAPAAQWLKQPTRYSANRGRQADLSAPAPRMPDGKPNLSGLWQPAAILIGDIATNLPPNSVPYQPWARSCRDAAPTTAATIRLPSASLAACPVPISWAIRSRFCEEPAMTVILYEAVHCIVRSSPMAVRFPEDMNPTWFGYSIGRWEGDALVVETGGSTTRLAGQRRQAGDRPAEGDRALHPQGLRGRWTSWSRLTT